MPWPHFPAGLQDWELLPVAVQDDHEDGRKKKKKKGGPAPLRTPMSTGRHPDPLARAARNAMTAALAMMILLCSCCS